MLFSHQLCYHLNALSHLLCDHIIFTIPVSNDVFILCTDALYVGVGSVLSVVRHYVELLVAIYSRQHMDRES